MLRLASPLLFSHPPPSSQQNTLHTVIVLWIRARVRGFAVQPVRSMLKEPPAPEVPVSAQWPGAPVVGPAVVQVEQKTFISARSKLACLQRNLKAKRKYRHMRRRQPPRPTHAYIHYFPVTCPQLHVCTKQREGFDKIVPHSISIENLVRKIDSTGTTHIPSS